jgi:hypothetical protein
MIVYLAVFRLSAAKILTGLEKMTLIQAMIIGWPESGHFCRCFPFGIDHQGGPVSWLQEI